MQNKLLDIYKNILKKPLDTVKKYLREKNTKLSSLLFIINSSLIGIYVYMFLCGVIKIINNNIKAEYMNSMNGFGMFGSFFSEMYEQVLDSQLIQNPDFKKIFIYAFLISLSYFMLQVILGSLLAKVFKAKGILRDYFNANALCITSTTAFVGMSMVVSLFSPWISLIGIILGLIMSIVLISKTYTECFKLIRNRVVYVVSIPTVLSFSITLFVVCKLFKIC